MDALANSGLPFTAETLVGEVGTPAVRGHVNSIGALFLAAASKGRIRKTGYRPSSTPSRRGGVIAVWVGAHLED